MRKTLTTIIILIVAFFAASSTQFWVYENNGEHTSYEVGNVDSISFVEPLSLEVSPMFMRLTSEGGSFSVDVVSSGMWDVYSEQSWISLGKNHGEGDDVFTINVSPNGAPIADTAVVSVRAHGISRSICIVRSGNVPKVGSVNGHGWIDLGLPSGTLWATCNVGSNSPEDIGSMFAWGEVSVKAVYSLKTYLHGQASDELIKYCNDAEYGKNGFVDDKTVLDVYDDVARNLWGDDWRMPTDLELKELVNECSWLWTNIGGTDGYKVIGPNGNHIFIPYNGGAYYSDRLFQTFPWDAWALMFESDVYLVDGLPRYEGAGVRPVANTGISVFPVAKSVLSEGESFMVSVTSKFSWAVAVSHPWISVSRTEGSGSGTFTVDIDASYSLIPDTATITVRSKTADIERVIHVTRSAQTGAEGNHRYVDLGLPSGTLWATNNVGGQFPQDRGMLYAWGETNPKTSYSWDNYKYGTMSGLTKYCYSSSYGKNGFVDYKRELDESDDPANVNWGKNWRLPTEMELRELQSACKWEYSGIDGVRGYKVIGKNGNSIFMPLSGFARDDDFYVLYGESALYWSKTISKEFMFGEYMSQTECAFCLHLNEQVCNFYDMDRYVGIPVRPVYVAQLNLSWHSGSVNYSGESIKMAVESNVAWTASSSQSWVHLSASEGDGSSTILIKVAPNETASIDTALVIVKSKVGNCIDTAKVVRHGKTVVNGYACVDLGLKSRTMWATFNIGADSPELFGDYFAWGEIAPKSNYEWSTYQYYGSFPNSVKLTKYVTNSEFGQDGFVDDISVLEQNDDAAAVLWGNDWSIPSQECWEELMSDCIWSWVSRDGVKGMQVLGPNGNYIFLPAAGCYYGGNTPEDLNLSGGYWCNSLGIPFWGPAYASCADFGLNQSVSQKNAIRYRGLSIRPVIVALKYRGWDSDGAYLSMFLNQANKTYEIYISSSEADQNLEVFSKGTYSISNEGTTMICNDDEGFSFDIAVDGNRLTFHNGKLGFQAYSFELGKIQL